MKPSKSYPYQFFRDRVNAEAAAFLLSRSSIETSSLLAESKYPIYHINGLD